MPLKAIRMRPGINRERTRYANEGGWYECDKIRFRQDFPEQIGGWDQVSANTFLGVCRSLWNWATLDGQNLVGLGTHLKFYIEKGGAYSDITPVRETQALTNPFDTVLGDETVIVNDTGHGALDGDYISISGSAAVGGITPDGEYQITYIDADSYSFEHSVAATSTVNGGGGASVSIDYYLNVGYEVGVPISGWGGGSWGGGGFGVGGTSTTAIRLWSQGNFGEDLVFCYRFGPICYWDATNGVSTRGVLLSSLSGATEVPVGANVVLVSDINRFVFAFGCPPEGSSTVDPMLIRWSDQEAAQVWKSTAANQAGSLRLSRGTEIVTALQARQEVLVFTNEAIYGLQYLGAPDGWGAQLLGGNISIAGQNAAIYVNGVAYWMGKDQFFIYDGTARVLPCDVRRYVFEDFNSSQTDQSFAGLNEAFSEVWWFYPSSGSTTVDRYVVYNFQMGVWYYGTMDRSAWLDIKLRSKPIAATYSNNLVEHEDGIDDRESGSATAINSYITSTPFDIEDGHHFSFVRRVLPDVTFIDSTATDPAITMTFWPMDNAGSDYNSPASVGGNSSFTVTQGTEVDVEPFTGQAYVRLRGRQLVMKVSSNTAGVTWQLGVPRLDMRKDGRR